MGIDLSKYKVAYKDRVLKALELQEIIWDENGRPTPPKNEEDRALRVKPKYLCVLIINDDGNIEALYDQAWKFQFIPILQREG